MNYSLNLFLNPEFEGYNAAVMAERKAAVMKDRCRLEQIALAAIEKSKNYSIDKIYQQWMGLFGNLNQSQ